MLRKMSFLRESEDEQVKRTGLTLDFDEIAKKGSMSKEEIAIGKWYGIYTNRQPGTFMCRIVIPGGIITSEQARLIARASEKFAQGRLNVTTRQAIQFHWLSLKNLPLLFRDLASKGLTTFHGCGDVNRNTTACPLAADCAYRRFNVYPYAREIARHLASSRDLDNLPRKFKITLSGCGGGCAQPDINCVGLVAVSKEIKGEPQLGFKVMLGGGMGWKAFPAQEVFSFVPRQKIVRLARAAGLLFRDHGDRYNRAASRLKFVVHRKGVDFCREELLKNLRNENVDVSDFETVPIRESGKPFPVRPLTDSECRTDNGKGIVRIIIPKGELTFHQLGGIADLSEMYGDQRIITTNRQNLELHNIDIEKLETVKSEAARLGFATEGANGLTDVIPCVGTTFCPKAVSETRKLYDALMPAVERDKYLAIREKAVINITGCPNSCSPYRIADVGFRGMRIREDLGSVEGYEVLLGGEGGQFGQKLGDFKFKDCREVLEIVLDIFLSRRKNEETLAGLVNRIGMDTFEEGVYHAA